MKNGLSFQKCSKEDGLEIQQLATQIWYDNYQQMISVEQIAYMLDKMYHTAIFEEEIQKGYHWYFIVLDQQTIGYLCLYPREEKMFLSKLYLLTAYQGKGYAQKALDFIIQTSQKQGYSVVYLTVNTNNSKAITSYTRYGFTITDAQVFDIGNGFVMDDYIMEYIIG